ncbi:MAG: hypothetical protein EZS28_015789 [Streblomastix strix]|uniref:Uncharacterized protein n=1 Tax=Streblomastix strix TaxID=222440 RepID=A0A5J4W2K0_9EUKA|nr:MAG: hypothetical protein EZS28_015789 [Streblomastix strix]
MPAPGFFNRLKNIIVKGIRWMNNNVVKPYAIPILNASSEIIPYGKQIANIVTKASAIGDKYLNKGDGGLKATAQYIPPSTYLSNDTPRSTLIQLRQ